MPVGLKFAGFGRFNEAVESGGGMSTIGVSGKEKNFRPTTKGRMAFSAALLSGEIWPFFQITDEPWPLPKGITQCLAEQTFGQCLADAFIHPGF